MATKPKKEVKTEQTGAQATPTVSQSSEKEKLLALYQTLQDLGVRSISDLENLIARAE